MSCNEPCCWEPGWSCKVLQASESALAGHRDGSRGYASPGTFLTVIMNFLVLIGGRHRSRWSDQPAWPKGVRVRPCPHTIPRAAPNSHRAVHRANRPPLYNGRQPEPLGLGRHEPSRIARKDSEEDAGSVDAHPGKLEPFPASGPQTNAGRSEAEAAAW